MFIKGYSGKIIYLRRINNLLMFIGINLKKTFSLVNFLRFVLEVFEFKRQGGKIRNYQPIIDEYNLESGSIRNQLFHADLLTSQFIFKRNPLNHLDIGSRIDGLVAQVASFRSLDVIDIRSLDIRPHKNINFIKKDILSFNIFDQKKKYDSISSIGCLSHIGLGRYGDKINVNGYILAIDKMCSLLKKKGFLYLMVPVGKDGVEFNSHRVFKPEDIIDNFKKNLVFCTEFHLIDDNGSLILNYRYSRVGKYNFAGGLFVFKKN